jgi:hypothetical protein
MQSPYKEIFINKLEENSKVSITGFIINKNKDGITIDDSTGTLSILIETNLELNSFVRVFGLYINNNLQAHLIQDLSNVNKQIYNKVKSLLNQKQ